MTAANPEEGPEPAPPPLRRSPYRLPVVPRRPDTPCGAPELAAARLIAQLPSAWHCTSSHPDGALILEITPPEGVRRGTVRAAVDRALTDPALRAWRQ